MEVRSRVEPEEGASLRTRGGPISSGPIWECGRIGPSQEDGLHGRGPTGAGHALGHLGHQVATGTYSTRHEATVALAAVQADAPGVYGSIPPAGGRG